MIEAQTRFARNGQVHLAYQVVGEGSTDLLLVDSWFHHVEMVWDLPEYARLLRRLGGFARVIHFDRRGTGLSDPVPVDDLPDIPTQVEDALTVLDAVGCESPAVFGVQDGTVIAMALAATEPRRCEKLVLYSPTAGGHAWPEDTIDHMAQLIAEDLAEGGGGGVPVLAPSRADDPRFVERFARLQRGSVRPGVVAHYFRQSMVADLRQDLPRIQASTLVLHRTEDQLVPIGLAREAAELIPAARFVELPGSDHVMFVGDTDPLLDEIEEFLTGARTGADADRILATVLFTDIVDSTRHAGDMGDRPWTDLLEQHHHLIRVELERYGGREVQTAGDGFLARFDSPRRAIECARAAGEVIRSIGLEIRAGVHMGEFELSGADVRGIAVHIGARIAALANGGEILVSSTVKDILAGSGFGFEDRGEYQLKGLPGTWKVFAVVAA